MHTLILSKALIEGIDIEAEELEEQLEWDEEGDFGLFPPGVCMSLRL